MTDNNPVLIQSKMNKTSYKNVNNGEELLKINSNNYNSNSQMLPKKNDSQLRESKNQSGIELPSQNDSKIGLLGRGPNLFNNLSQNSQQKNKLSESDFPNRNNSINNNDKNNFDKNSLKKNKNNTSFNNLSKKDEHDSFSAKSSSMSSKRSNKVGAQKMEKVKTFAEDLKYKNLKDEERNENSINSIKKQKSRKDDDNFDRDLDDDEDYNYDDNLNYDKKDHRRLTKREKIVILFGFIYKKFIF